jgi:hypothetical protein
MRLIKACRATLQSAKIIRDEMSRSFVTRLFSSLAVALSPVLLVLLFTVPLAAQRPVPGTPSNDPRDPENQQSTNKADMRNRELLMGHSRTLARRGGSGPEGSALPQIKEDFERIQLIEREMMKSVFVDVLVDYQQIQKASAEIKKRAARLKTNLAYPEPLNRSKARKNRPGNSDEDIKMSLANLDQSIMSFVVNPIFQLQQQVVETQLAMKAVSDLLDIIELSEATKKHAERLERKSKH